MTFDVSKVIVCRNCGVLVLPEALELHQSFHQAIVDLTTAVESINKQTQGLARLGHDLTGVVKEHLKVTQRQVTGRST